MISTKKIHKSQLFNHGKNSKTSVMVRPAIIFPPITLMQVDKKSKPKNIATHVPVHTPVKGKGIATNTNTAINFFQ